MCKHGLLGWDPLPVYEDTFVGFVRSGWYEETRKLSHTLGQLGEVYQCTVFLYYVGDIGRRMQVFFFFIVRLSKCFPVAQYEFYAKNRDDRHVKSLCIKRGMWILVRVALRVGMILVRRRRRVESPWLGRKFDHLMFGLSTLSQQFNSAVLFSPLLRQKF